MPRDRFNTDALQDPLQVGLGMNIMTGAGADSNGTAEDTREEEMPDRPEVGGPSTYSVNASPQFYYRPSDPN